MDEFQALIGALWSDLGLGAPPLARGSARLVVDGQAVALSLSPDEANVVVRTDLGPLARDPPRAAEQLRTLLRDGAGLVLGCGAALRLKPSADPASPAVATVEAASPCRVGALPALRRAIEDALALADIHRPTLAAGGTTAGIVQALPAHDHLIFRL